MCGREGWSLTVFGREGPDVDERWGIPVGTRDSNLAGCYLRDKAPLSISWGLRYFL